MRTGVVVVVVGVSECVYSVGGCCSLVVVVDDNATNNGGGAALLTTRYITRREMMEWMITTPTVRIRLCLPHKKARYYRSNYRYQYLVAIVNSKTAEIWYR